MERKKKDKAKSMGPQGAPTLRSVVKLKMATVAAAAAAGKTEVEMSSASADGPPQQTNV